MANPAWLQKKNSKYLWFALLGLGFEPDSAVSGKTNIKHIHLGPNMFDKPNKDAFYIVINFLLEKLNPTRFHEAYRHCWPVLNHKADAEFRKVTCAWLREVMDESSNAGYKVVASLLLSPGGPRFISLMLHLANHVMLHEMKTFTTDESWAPEAAAAPSSSLDMAVKRHKLVHNRFLRTAVEQDSLLQGYQRRAHLLVKSMRDIRAENTKYDELLKRHSSDGAQEGTSTAEKTEKVRALWSAIDGMLSAIKEEQHAVDCVLKGDVDRYVLDGTDGALKIPRILLERIERLPHQLSAGNMYEGGQLNLLCVLELTNHALQLLRDKRSHVGGAPPAQLNPHFLQEKCQQMARVVQDLNLLRQRISKEEIPEVGSAIRELEVEWNKKWMDTLKDVPLASFLNDDLALGLLSPMAPLSFTPAAEASYKNGVFSQYPAKLLEGTPAESKTLEGVVTNYSSLKSSSPVTVEKVDAAPAPEVISRANTSLDWLFDTPSPHTMTSLPPIQASVTKTPRAHSKVLTTRTQTQILDWECDNLANQFADAVTTASPVEGSFKALELEDLLGTLRGDPFSTKKQLPRTPESLIMDVKSSWRKAMEEDEAEKSRQPAKFNDSITGRLTPLGEPQKVLLSPIKEVLPQNVSPDFTPAATCQGHTPVRHRVGMLLKSSLSLDASNFEFLESPSGPSSSAVHFSLAHETFPEMLSSDSLLSLDMEASDLNEDEFLIPHMPVMKTETKCTPLTTHQAPSPKAFQDGSFLLLNEVTALDKDWLMGAATSEGDADKVFSLDLDTLESPTHQREHSLPKLITFSPIDDL
ncbi:HAUS augmin-like complex subunit 6 [Genypterus blacodes]|uniref:HAUS augmin-like complex subunit 6 n=1 Tax=Genypterus blacodes TaxID=154954 RepID=UPI003F7640B8